MTTTDEVLKQFIMNAATKGKIITTLDEAKRDYISQTDYNMISLVIGNEINQSVQFDNTESFDMFHCILKDTYEEMIQNDISAKEAQLYHYFDQASIEGRELYGWNKWMQDGTDSIAVCLNMYDGMFTVVDKDSQVIDDRTFTEFEDAVDFYLEKIEEINQI